MKLLVGLGNPGSEYAATRHNVGFMAVDGIVRRHSSFPAFKDKFNALAAQGTIGGEKVVLLKPQTYMNESGRAVLAACTFYKIAPADIIVIHDDMDLAVGRVRVKTGGSAGGHNGIKSIDDAVGPEYARVRIGIGRPDTPAQAVDWVLSRFAADEAQTIAAVLGKAAEHVELLLAGDFENFMNRVK
ncbi:MAG: aminoacyl-tRNA hydrolase [Alphaproteobacteria bacterium]|nr:aminoacyl-tRNA hydrolase [Alphaproteobacteria bacterium]